MKDGFNKNVVLTNIFFVVSNSFCLKMEISKFEQKRKICKIYLLSIDGEKLILKIFHFIIYSISSSITFILHIQ